MSYMESSSFCDRSEYVRFEQNRLQANDLYIDELYTLMLAIKSNDRAKQAAKKPARIIELAKPEPGIQIVKFAILSDDFDVQATGQSELPNGYWAEAPSMVRIDKLPVINAYFKNYENGIDDEWQRISSSLELGNLALSNA